MSEDIAIIGIGLFPFGRHEGVNAIQMGVHAANLALDDIAALQGGVQAGDGIRHATKMRVTSAECEPS